MICKFYRFIKSRVGCSLKQTHCRRHLVPPGKQVAYQLPRLQTVFLALQEFQDLCMHKIVLVETDNTTVVSYINREGGMRSGPLCALLWRILTWCARNQVTLKAQHRLAECGHRQAIQARPSPESSLLQEVFQAICNRWHRPQLDLFATRFNNK